MSHVSHGDVAEWAETFLLEKRVMHWHESQRNIRASNMVGAA